MMGAAQAELLLQQMPQHVVDFEIFLVSELIFLVLSVLTWHNAVFLFQFDEQYYAELFLDTEVVLKLLDTFLKFLLFPMEVRYYICYRQQFLW